MKKKQTMKLFTVLKINKALTMISFLSEKLSQLKLYYLIEHEAEIENKLNNIENKLNNK